VGLVISLAFGVVALAVFGPAFEVGLWWPDPLEGFHGLGDALFGRGSGVAVWRCTLLVVPLAVVWSWIGGWIARHELVRRRLAVQPDGPWEPDQLSATRFVWRKARTLPAPIGFIAAIVLSVLCVAALAGLINRVPIFGVGAVLVSLGLPLFLVASLVTALVLVGGLSFFIMPATTASEGTDVFDAVSRGYSYLYQCPIWFAVWEGITIALAGLPLLGLAALFHKEPNLLPAQAKPVLGILTTGLSLSMFWTLQTMVYLKLRRVVDETPEQEIWMGSAAEAKPKSPAAAASVTEEKASSPNQPEKGQDQPNATAANGHPEPALPRSTPLTFGDTLRDNGGLAVRSQLTLLVGVVWAAAVLVAGAVLTWQLAGFAGQGLTLPGLRAAVTRLADQQPVQLIGMALGVIALAGLGLGRQLKWVARQAAVLIVYRAKASPGVKIFPGRLRGPGMGSIFIATAAIELLLVAGVLLPLAWRDECPYGDVIALGGLGAAVLTLGSLGLGAEAASRGTKEYRPGILGVMLGNGVETVASAVASLGLGLVRWAAILSFVAFTWWLTCESISWWGGENIHWVRWGLDGRLGPPSDGGLYQVASWIAGVWFFLIVGWALMYPISHALTWGAAAYLRALQQGEDAPKTLLALSEGERKSLAERRRKQEDLKQKLHNLKPEANDKSAKIELESCQTLPAESPVAMKDSPDHLPRVPPGAPLPP
jgi:hypothetical protein